MKKIIAFSLLMLLAFSATAFAQMDKIATVHSMRAISESKAGKNVNSEIKKKQQAYEADVKAQQEKVQNLQKRLKQMGAQYQSGMIKEQQFRNAQQELASAGAQLNVLGEMSNRNFKQDVQNLQKPIYKLFAEVVQDIAKQKGYKLVIDLARGAVAFGDSSIDITEQVVKEMDKRWKK